MPSFPLTNTQLPYPYAQPLQGPGTAAPEYATPAPGTWTANQPTDYPSGAAGAASYGPLSTGAKPRRRGHLALAGVSGLLLVAVLASAAFWIYSVFASHTETEAARYLPANTSVFVSIDIVSAAVNGYHVSSSNLDQASGQSDSLKQSTGLDWQHDILPWVNRDVAYAVFQRPASTGSAGPLGQVGWAFLIQSRDDTAAQAAMKKVADFQGQHGTTMTTSTYGGFTLYGQSLPDFQYGPSSDGSGGTSATLIGSQAHAVATGTTYTAGKGWALVASDGTSAQIVIDRLNGATGTLADTPAFQSATSNLPSNRFGTVFIDTRSLVGATNPSSAGGSSVLADDVYPTIGGYLARTNSGLRMQITAQATRPLGIGDLGGDTTGLASLVPANAIVYGGVANFGKAVATAMNLGNQTNGQSAATPDPLLSQFGVPATAPVFQQPAAATALRTPSQGVSGPIFLLRAPDAVATTEMLKSAATTQHWTLKAVKVDGQAATDIYAQTPGTWLTPEPASGPYNPTPPGAPHGPFLAGVAAQVNGTFVLATSHTDLAAIIDVANGAAPALTQDAKFQQLAGQAPRDAAAAVYYDLTQLGSSINQSGGQSNIFARTAAVYASEIWNDRQTQLTVDLKLNN
jgi:hypothetical protein